MTWLSAIKECEGAPIALRVRPDMDTPEHRAGFPFLAVVTHALAVVRADGLPDADYNDTLTAFDHETHLFLEGRSEGLVVLVETIAGRRNYYAYVADPKRPAGGFERWRALYPYHDLSFRERPDPAWDVFQEYRRLFSF